MVDFPSISLKGLCDVNHFDSFFFGFCDCAPEIFWKSFQLICDLMPSHGKTMVDFSSIFIKE